MGAVEILAGHESQHGVPEEFETLVGITLTRHVELRALREGQLDQAGVAEAELVVAAEIRHDAALVGFGRGATGRLSARREGAEPVPERESRLGGWLARRARTASGAPAATTSYFTARTARVTL